MDLNNYSKVDLDNISNVFWQSTKDEYRERDNEKYRKGWKDTMEYRQYHCKIVADLALSFHNEVNYLDIDENLLYISCLLHDVRKIEKSHNIMGEKYLKKSFIAKEYFTEEDIRKIATFIKYHKGSKIDMSREAFSISITEKEFKYYLLLIRVADKISKLVYMNKYKKLQEEDKNKTKENIYKITLPIVQGEEDLEAIREELLNKIEKM